MTRRGTTAPARYDVGRMPPRSLWILALLGALACNGGSDAAKEPQTAQAAAAELCELARVVHEDPSIEPDAKASTWLRRAGAEIHQPAVREVLEQTAQSGHASVKVVFFEMMQDALGKPWVCPAAEALLP
jgi:hypothetical protein